MDSWERFSETELPSTGKFYLNIDLKKITKDEYKTCSKSMEHL